MSAASTPTTQRLLLGRELRKWREEHGLKSEDVAREMGWSTHKLRQAELGKQTMVPAELDKLIGVLGVDGDDAERLRDLGAAARKRGEYGSVSDWARTYIGMEADAAELRIYAETVLPGLLQSEDYARALAGASAVTPAADVDRIARSRVRRRERLMGEMPPKLHVILDEATLRRQVGGVEVMRGQLRLLTELARLPNITLQVLPFSSGAHSGQGSSFILLRLDEPAVTLVYAESLTKADYLDRAHVDVHKKVHADLCAVALSADATLSLLDRAINEERDGR